MKEPEISVGIVNAQEIHFTLNGNFFAKGETVSGDQAVSFSEGGILWNENLYRELTFTPQDDQNSFSLYDVTIGINFHWERQETQVFSGTLKLVVEEEKIVAINILPVEEYLTSVISSEMSANSSLELLKAHAVVSRSWLLAQIEKRKALSGKDEGFFSFTKTKEEYIRWYDREDHTIFDVCADDHCQRYQGITKASNATVAEAVRATRGCLLMHNNKEVGKVELNKNNGWQHTFTNMPESDSYSIKEEKIPLGYYAAYFKDDYEFTVMNTPGLAQTGQLIWPIPLFALAGVFFLMMGFVILRKPGKENA